MEVMTVPTGADPDRLDCWLARLASISRSEARRRIEAGSVYVDGRRCRISSRTVGAGAELKLEKEERAFDGAHPRILFRDDTLVVLEKPPGMAVQATRGTVEGTLESWLKEQDGVTYTAFHHRLDRDAQGLICAALDRRANKGLARSFGQRLARRSYRALVHGFPEDEEGLWRHRQVQRGRRRKALPWSSGGEGEAMEARWSRVEPRPPYGLIRVSLVTGRTHQIRLQAAAEGHPIVGDSLYGFGESGGLRLQACELGLEHPITGKLLDWTLEEPASWQP